MVADGAGTAATGGGGVEVGTITGGSSKGVEGVGANGISPGAGSVGIWEISSSTTDASSAPEEGASMQLPLLLSLSVSSVHQHVHILPLAH